MNKEEGRIYLHVSRSLRQRLCDLLNHKQMKHQRDSNFFFFAKIILSKVHLGQRSMSCAIMHAD